MAHLQDKPSWRKTTETPLTDRLSIQGQDAVFWLVPRNSLNVVYPVLLF